MTSVHIKIPEYREVTLPLINSFISIEEKQLNEEFLEQGYVIRSVDQPEALHALRHRIIEMTCEHLQFEIPDDDESFLNNIHQRVPVSKLNALRLFIYNRMNAESWFRPTYFALGKSIVETLVGNELAMQNHVNLSIQMPKDDSSLIGMHSDIFGAETPFEVNQWIPLVNVWDTKSMYILSPEKNRDIWPQLKEITTQGGTEKLFEAVKEELEWIPVKYGEVLIFSPIVLHGNLMNEIPETRWSLNVRFTGLFTPYLSEEKTVGGFYLPVTTKTVSRIGMNYQHPTGFED